MLPCNFLNSNKKVSVSLIGNKPQLTKPFTWVLRKIGLLTGDSHVAQAHFKMLNLSHPFLSFPPFFSYLLRSFTGAYLLAYRRAFNSSLGNCASTVLFGALSTAKCSFSSTQPDSQFHERDSLPCLQDSEMCTIHSTSMAALLRTVCGKVSTIPLLY